MKNRRITAAAILAACLSFISCAGSSQLHHAHPSLYDWKKGEATKVKARHFDKLFTPEELFTAADASFMKPGECVKVDSRKYHVEVAWCPLVIKQTGYVTEHFIIIKYDNGDYVDEVAVGVGRYSVRYIGEIDPVTLCTVLDQWMTKVTAGEKEPEEDLQNWVPPHRHRQRYPRQPSY